MDCPGSQKPFTPGTLSRDGEVAQCPSCGRNYYVTDRNVVESHPVTATTPIPAQTADMDEIRARIANVIRTHRLVDGRCEVCGQQAVYQSLHQADVLMGMSGLSINLT